MTGSEFPTLRAVHDAHLLRLESTRRAAEGARFAHDQVWREWLTDLAEHAERAERALQVAIHEATEAGLPTREVGAAVGKSGEWVRQNRDRHARIARDEARAVVEAEGGQS